MKKHFMLFFIFECMLNGSRPPQKIKMTDTVNRYLTSLWNWKLNKTDPDTPIDPYISDTFVNICSRTQIALNLWCLDTLFPNEWTDLLMQYIKPQNDYDDVCNLFRADVFRICTNIEKLIIHASSRDGKLQYAFDLFALLSIVFNLKGAITVIIKSRVPFKNKKMISSVFNNDNTSDFNENADVNTDDEEISDIRSWIHNMCQQNNGQSWINIEKAFGAKGLAISYSRTGRTENEDCITIKRRRESQIRNDISYRYELIKSKQQMNQYVAPVNQRESPNKIKQIDEALATYYDRVGVRNYFDSNGIGRFSAFIEREAFDVDALSIEKELGTRSNADNTMYTEFDAQFPLIGIADCDIDKDTIIFYILQFCYLHNEPPTIDEVTNEFALTRIHNTRDTTKLAQIDDALGKYYTRLGVDDYFDSNGIGKLSGFIERESFDVDLGSMRNEIGPSSTTSNTMYTEFDPHFPLNGVLLPLLSRYNVDKDDIVFYVLQFCFKYNDPPTYSQIRTQIGNIAIRHTFSSMIQGHTKIQQMDEALAKYYHSLGINGYVDSNDMGKLAAFIEQNAMDNHIMAIEQEIGAHANPHISRYIQFDPQFPFHDDVWRLMADHDIQG
eukprot:613458_1